MTTTPVNPNLMLIEARKAYNRAADILAESQREFLAVVTTLPCCTVCGRVWSDDTRRGRYNKSECSRCERDHAHAEER